MVDTDRARTVVTSWSDYLREHRDEIRALQVLFAATPTGRVSYGELREPADRIRRPPYGWTPDLLWNAYASLEVGRVKHADRHTVSDLVRLVCFALVREDDLVPYADVVAERQGVLGVVFRKAQNKVQDPAKLKRLIVDLIGKENRSATGVDIKGDTYEELLAKGAEDVKSGAGQCFMPRALIEAIVACIRPTPADTVCDPVCGTGGFLLEAYRHASEGPLTPEDRQAGSSTAWSWSTAPPGPRR